MTDDTKLIPVLQLQDKEAMMAALDHMIQKGYRCDVEPFDNLPTEEHDSWMTPENGGYLFYLEQSEKFEEGMNTLGIYFGCDT